MAYINEAQYIFDNFPELSFIFYMLFFLRLKIFDLFNPHETQILITVYQ